MPANLRIAGVGLGISRVIQLPELEQFIFAPEIVATLREILGVELSIFPNITVRSNARAPWHLDEAFRKPSPGWEDISQCDFVQAMIYLQDNGLQGGGLDVVPGSHRLNQLGRALGSIHAVIQFLLAHKQTVMSKSGDCIIWDNRLLHRSTQNLIEGRKNYGLQWTIAKRAADKKRFLQHLRSRGRDDDQSSSALIVGIAKSRRLDLLGTLQSHFSKLHWVQILNCST